MVEKPQVISTSVIEYERRLYKILILLSKRTIFRRYNVLINLLKLNKEKWLNSYNHSIYFRYSLNGACF